MKLSARLLTAIGGVNVFNYTTAVEAIQGDRFDVYLQLIDIDQHKNSNGFYPEGLRYMPAVGATLSVQVLNLDTSKQFTRVATQPYSQDASIWKFSILTTDPVVGTVNLKLTLTEGATVRTIYLQGPLRVDGIFEQC